MPTKTHMYPHRDIYTHVSTHTHSCLLSGSHLSRPPFCFPVNFFMAFSTMGVDGQTVCHSSEPAWHRLEPGKWVRRQDQPPRVLGVSLERRQALLVLWALGSMGDHARSLPRQYPSGSRQSEGLQVRAGTAASQILPG